MAYRMRSGRSIAAADGDEAYELDFLMEWCEWERKMGVEVALPEGIERTLRLWRYRWKVPHYIVLEAVAIAFSSRAVLNGGVGAYFCGVVWNEIRHAAADGFRKEGTR